MVDLFLGQAMATYRRFEELPVWQKSADLAVRIFEWTDNPNFPRCGDLVNQLRRATLSISNNIAEGFERGTTRELLQFIYVARGSAGECRSMLCILERMGPTAESNTHLHDLKSEFENVSRQLRGWAASLQNSEIEGQRLLSDKTKDDYERKIRKKRFLEQQDRYRRELEQRLKMRVNDSDPDAGEEV